LINCAGGFGAIGTIDQIDVDEWDRTVRDNLRASSRLLNFSALLEKSPIPRIINLSGGAPSPIRFSAICLSKAAIVRLDESLPWSLPSGYALMRWRRALFRRKAHEATIAAGHWSRRIVQFQRTDD